MCRHCSKFERVPSRKRKAFDYKDFIIILLWLSMASTLLFTL